jgi:hypothetical protein
MKRTKFNNVTQARQEVLGLLTLNEIMTNFDPGTVIVRSFNAKHNSIPWLYDRKNDSWLMGTPDSRKYYFRWRKGDNPIYKVIDKIDLLPENHPIRLTIEDLRVLLSENRIGRRNTSRDFVRI